ncbi:MAG: glycosyltransferase family 2 protein [Actinomycetota bacterium]
MAGRAVLATVLIPTFDHGPTLRCSIPTALNQTVEDIEVFVIGDGVPDITREIVRDFSRQDGRIRFFDNPKGPRHGEIHRHAALQEARGELICYLSDDDLWLPDHIEHLAVLLGDADFAHACPARIDPDGGVAIYPGDLSMAHFRRSIMEGFNFIPLSHAAHRLTMYRRLPYGWRTTPPGIPTDLYMWQQFLAEPSCRVVSGGRPTVLNFPQSVRGEMTHQERLAELQRWAERTATEEGRQEYVSAVLDNLLRDRARLWAEKERLEPREAELAAVYRSRTWRLRSRLLRIPGAGTVARAAAARRRRRSSL